jgi:hypothetical protein
MNSTGRKSLKEEIEVIKYMSELAPKIFDFLNDCIIGRNRQDKKWATEQMMKLYAKAIPQELFSNSDNPLVVQVVQVSKEVADKYSIQDNATTSSTIENSPGQPSV